MMRDRRFYLLLLIGIACFAGCKATAPTRSGPDAVFLAPEFPTLKLQSLAYLSTASTVQDPVAVQTAETLLRSYLTGGQEKFLVVDVSSAQTRAQKEGVSDALASTIRVWRDKQSLDRSQLKTLGEKLGFDGFVVATIDQWREEQVDWTSEGASFTEVGMTLSIYDARTGLLAWSGNKMERRESVHYRHGKGGTGVYSEGDVERTERADKLAPPPPPAEEIAESVVQSLIAGLPDKPGTGGSAVKQPS
jgi:hypothetical protein